MNELINIEVVYAEPEKQWVIALQAEQGITVSDAIERSGIAAKVPGLEISPQRVGIFGRKATLDQALKDGDRVELYRALIADPKEVRRARAEAAKAAGKA